jgi:predicted tellurium resistance membrane protein TerC
MKQPIRWLQVIALVAFFFVNPLIVGSVYLALLVIRSSAKCISDTASRFICMSIACLAFAFIAPLFFVAFPGLLVCAIFAAVLIWAFAWSNKAQTPKQPNKQEDDVIDVEVISVTTIEGDK